MDTSLSQLYIGLDCKTTEVGINKADYFISEVDSETAYKNYIKGDYLNTCYGVTSYDILDPNLNKDVGVFGDNVNNWPEYRSEEYKKRKKEVTENILNLLYNYFPKLREHIKVTELGTPHTMKRYTNNTDGAVYGWEQNINQGGFNRLSIKSDFRNVYLTGAWTNPGGGFEGAITGGILTAERILKDQKNKEENILYNKNDFIEPDMNLKAFMIGMVANFDKNSVSKDKKLLLEFVFDNKDKFYIQIKNRKVKLLKEGNNEKPNVIVNTSHKIWYNIVFNNLDGKGCMFDGELIVLRDADEFLNIPKYFNTNSFTENSNEKIKQENKKFNTIFWIMITLVPCILTGVVNNFYKDERVIALIAILYTSFIYVYTFLWKHQIRRKI